MKLATRTCAPKLTSWRAVQAGPATWRSSAGRRTARRLEQLTAVEWDVILAVLGRHQRWQVAWQLAQQAPALWSARLLRELSQAGWSPEDESERQGFFRLAEKAHTCLALGRPKEKFLRNRT